MWMELDCIPRGSPCRARSPSKDADSLLALCHYAPVEALRVARHGEAEIIEGVADALFTLAHRGGEPLAVASRIRNQLSLRQLVSIAYQVANRLLKDSLTIRKRCLPKTHPHFGYSHHNLGKLMSDRGQLDAGRTATLLGTARQAERTAEVCRR